MGTMYHVWLVVWITLDFPANLNGERNGLLSNVTYGYDSVSNEIVESMSMDRLIALFLAVVAVIANTVSLLAIINIRGTLSANQRFIVSLVIGDIYVCLSVLLYVAINGKNNYLLGPEHYSHICFNMIVQGMVITGHVISLLNLSCLALDHFMAISNGMVYPQFMTKRRACLMICLMWFIAHVCGFSRFLVPVTHYDYCVNITLYYCQMVNCSMYEPQYLLYPFVLMCLITMAVFYIRIFVTLHRHQQNSGRHERYLNNNLRGIITTLVILGCFLVCWLPYCIFEMWATIQIVVDHNAILPRFIRLMILDYYLYDLMLMHCLSDPIVYAIRMREVQNGYREMIKKCVFKHRRSHAHAIDTSGVPLEQIKLCHKESSSCNPRS